MKNDIDAAIRSRQQSSCAIGLEDPAVGRPGLGARDREESMADAKGFEPDAKVRVRDYKIGCIGAGMIMAECHLAAYKEAGFPVAAIASRTKANAEKVAKRWS